MTAPLQKAPAWLLRAFNLQTLGEAPRAFGDTVVPVVDVGDMYIRDQQFTHAEQDVAAGPGAVMTVPTHEQWRLLAVTASCVLNAADVALSSYVTVHYRPRSPGVLLAFSRTEAGGATLARWAYKLLPVPILLLPGDQLVASAGQLSGGAFANPATLTLSVVGQFIRTS